MYRRKFSCLTNPARSCSYLRKTNFVKRHYNNDSSIGGIASSLVSSKIETMGWTIVNQFHKKILENQIKLHGNQLSILTNIDGSLKLSSELPPIRAKSVADINKIASESGRRKYNWIGIVYEINEINPRTNKIIDRIGGASTSTMRDRWHWYIRNSLNKPEKFDLGIHKKIRNYLFNVLGFSKNDLLNGKNWNYGLIYLLLNKRFKRFVRIVCFSFISLRNQEISFIKENNLLDDGLNQQRGGEGLRAPLPIIKIAFYITIGYSIPKIVEVLFSEHGIICGETTVARRITKFFDNYQEAQIKFMRPLFAWLIQLKFELYEINDAFDRFMHLRISAFFGEKLYYELKNLSYGELMELPITRQIDATYWSQEGHTSFKRIPVNILKHLLFTYISGAKALHDRSIKLFLTGKAVSTLDKQLLYQLEGQLGYEKNWSRARRYVIGSFLIQELRKVENLPQNLQNDAISEIYTKVGYSKETSKSNSSYLTKKFFCGFSTVKVLKFLNENPSITSIEDFDAVFSCKYGSYNDFLLNRESIIELIINNANHTTAAETAHMESSEFYKQVNALGYSSYWDARQDLCLPKLITMMREDDNGNFNHIFTSIGYSINNAKNHNELTKKLFNNIFNSSYSGQKFLKKNPNLASLKQIKDFIDKNGLDEDLKNSFVRIVINPKILAQICDSIIKKYSDINYYSDISKKIGISYNLKKVIKEKLTLPLQAFEKLKILYDGNILHQEIEGRKRIYTH